MSVKRYQPKNFDSLLGTPGFSDKMLKDHFKLYEGYVKNVNQLSDSFASIRNPEQYKEPWFAELKRRFGWEFNGMRLHEYYFANMGRDAAPIEKESALFEKISEDFESFERWLKKFAAIGGMRGIGWVILAYDGVGDRLFNIWVNEHDLGLLAGAEPLLVMDVFEHAFMTDYGLERGKYVSAFLKAVQWTEVQHRFEKVRREMSLSGADIGGAGSATDGAPD